MAMMFANNATSTLAAGITNVAVSLTVQSGKGALYPTLGAGDYFYGTLTNVAGVVEIIRVTARAADTFTIVRAQDSTTALAWNTGDKVELRLVAASLNDLPKLDEANVFTGVNSAPTAAAGTNTTQLATTAFVIANTQNSSTRFLNSVAGTNTITATLAPAIASYVAGQMFELIAAATNTGAVTININGVGASPITKNGTTALVAGDIVIGQAYILIRDAAGNFQLTGGSSSGSGGGASAGGVIYENSTVISANYTLTAAKNGLMVGPLTVNTGITLTVPTGQRMIIL
jgi:hypothetical protein